jgi:DNA-binding NarL/FixJ family response regulator
MSAILIADDHPMVRAGLRQFLESELQLSDIGEASSGQEVLDALRASRYDLLILDINMPDRGGLDILRNVQAAWPDLRVLVVSGYPERQYAVNVLKAGASGYLQKEAAPAELARAVNTVMSGRRYVSGSLAEQLASDIGINRDQPVHATLSEREFQIFCKLAMGRSVSEIAKELFLSVKTVSTYRSRVLEKMNFRTNADITAYALRNELIQSP